MRGLTPTAVFSESRGGGGGSGHVSCPIYSQGKKVPESGLCYCVCVSQGHIHRSHKDYQPRKTKVCILRTHEKS